MKIQQDYVFCNDDDDHGNADIRTRPIMRMTIKRADHVMKNQSLPTSELSAGGAKWVAR